MARVIARADEFMSLAVRFRLRLVLALVVPGAEVNPCVPAGANVGDGFLPASRRAAVGRYARRRKISVLEFHAGLSCSRCSQRVIKARMPRFVFLRCGFPKSQPRISRQVPSTSTAG